MKKISHDSKNFVILILTLFIVAQGFLLVSMNQCLREEKEKVQILIEGLNEADQQNVLLNEQIQDTHKSYRDTIKNYMKSQGVILHPFQPNIRKL